MNILFKPIDATVKTSTFDCDDKELNGYFKKYALKNHKIGISKCSVAYTKENPLVGFFCWNMASFKKSDIDPKAAAGLPNYPIPAVRIARLGVDKRFQRGGTGSAILAHILYDMALPLYQSDNSPGFSFILVDAKNDRAKSFYNKFGFISFKQNHLALFLPMKTLEMSTMK